jgi:serine/threonine protein kinase
LRNRYLVRELISRGGFGAAYLIEDYDCFNKQHILKELRPNTADGKPGSEGYNDTAVRLFKREAQTLLTLNHPGIPHLYAYFVQDNYSYLLQEYIPGKTLAEILAPTPERAEGKITETEARTILKEIAEILSYLHNHKPAIIHRDIKPQNLMRHTDGRLLLIDFGAVCLAANQDKSSPTLIGSPGYSPPEQILGQPVPQSDLYAAAMTIVRLLTGVHPSRLTNKRKDQVDWERYTSITTAFRDLINELLAPDSLRRLASAEILLQRLAALPEIVVPPPVIPQIPTSIETSGLNSAASSTSRSKTEAMPLQELPVTAPSIITALMQQEWKPKGLLTEIPVPVLLFRCYQKRFSGMLRLQRHNLMKKVYFDQGTVVFAASAQPEDRLSEHLRRCGRLSASDYDRATNVANSTGQRMGEILIKLGIININQLTSLIVEHISCLTYSVFGWNAGEYEFLPGEPPEEVIKMPYSTADIIFEGIRRLENQELIKCWLGAFNRPLRTTTDPLLLYQNVNLNPHEAYIVSRIDSAMSLEEILSLGGLPEDETLRTVCGLIAIGMLETVATDRQDSVAFSPRVVGNVLGQPNPLPAEIDFATAAQFCYEVESKLHSIDRNDAYGVLEVSRQATLPEITEAFQTMARKFHPDRHAQLSNFNLSLRNDLEKIFRALSQAYEILRANPLGNRATGRWVGLSTAAQPGLRQTGNHPIVRHTSNQVGRVNTADNIANVQQPLEHPKTGEGRLRTGTFLPLRTGQHEPIKSENKSESKPDNKVEGALRTGTFLPLRTGQYEPIKVDKDKLTDDVGKMDAKPISGRRITASSIPTVPSEPIRQDEPRRETFANGLSMPQYTTREIAIPNSASNLSGKSGQPVASSANDWFRQGENAYLSGNYPLARESFEQAITLEPEESRYYLYLARTLAQLPHTFQAAETAFYRAIALDPQNADYYAEFGLFYHRLSLNDRATVMFDNCYRLAPNHPIIRSLSRS